MFNSFNNTIYNKLDLNMKINKDNNEEYMDCLYSKLEECKNDKELSKKIKQEILLISLVNLFQGLEENK